MRQNRLKSPVLWSAAAGVALLLIRHFGLDAEAAAQSGLADSAFKLICGLLALFGVVNNPTDKSHF